MGGPAQESGAHGCVVLVGEAGVLIRGASGAGKSALALALIEAAGRAGLFARLVADDRVLLRAACGRLLARPHPALAGRVEKRGEGIVAVEHEPCGVVRCVVDLEPAGARGAPDSAVAGWRCCGPPRSNSRRPDARPGGVEQGRPRHA